MNLADINELTRKAYDHTAGKYHDHFKNEIQQKEYDRQILDKLSQMLAPDSLILDAGCGPSGHIGKYLADMGHRVIGIDLSKNCVDHAAAYHPELEFKVMDMMNTNFENNSFDAIISFYAIIYTPKDSIDKIFSEFNRILKREGKLLIVVKKGSDEGIIDNEWYEGHKVYFTHFSEHEVREYFESSDFTIDLMHTRKPYEFELAVDRIYAIGQKK